MIHVKDHLNYGILDNIAIINALAATPKTGCIVMLPPGVFKLSEPIVLDSQYCLTLQGECCEHPYFGRAATEIQVPKSQSGIIIRGRPAGTAERCRIKGICVTGNRSGLSADGIIIQGARTNIVDCGIYGFDGHGIRIEGSVSSGINSDQFRIEDTTVGSCRGNAFHIVGNVANAGRFVGASGEGCGGWGFYEEGTLGNYYESCHTTDNKLGPYCVASAKSSSTLIGCYSEGNQTPSFIGQNSMSLGGTHGAGWQMTDRNGVRAGVVLGSNAYGLSGVDLAELEFAGFRKPITNGTATLGEFRPLIGRLGYYCGAVGVNGAPDFWYLKAM